MKFQASYFGGTIARLGFALFMASLTHHAAEIAMAGEGQSAVKQLVNVDGTLKSEGDQCEIVSELDSLELELPEKDPDKIDLEKAPPATKTFLTNLVLEALPHEYEDTKRWGGKTKRWDGVHLKMKGLKLKTKRKWKEVNHGTWKKYRVNLVDPEEHLDVRVVNMHRVAPGKIGFDLLLGARLDLYGRLQEWNHGLRLISISTEASADVLVKVGLEVSTRLNAAKFPPDVIILPKANSADIDLQSFELNRISRADGPVVRELGDALEKVVRKKLVEKEQKLVAKINRQIEKNKDDLRLSLHDVVKHKWLGISSKRKATVDDSP